MPKRTKDQTPQQGAAGELLKRRGIRNSLSEWARYRGFEPAPHHQLFIREIEAFLESNDEVLLLFAPPGSAKSTYVSVLLPSWYLANHPTHSILAATHNVEFAERWGRRVRNDIAADSRVLGILLSEDSKAAARWSLTGGGEYYGVGAGVGISGFRANLGVGDDLFGSREDAYSETVRQKRWDWYVDDFSARLKPGAKRILMNTRWHEEDVAGRVLEQIERKEIKGRVISISAIAEANDPLGREPGEYLWDDPEGYNYGAFLRARQKETSAMMWSALYQQRPAPEEGDYFKAEWLKPCEKLPAKETMRVYGGSDYAVTADGGDYTVHAVVGLDPDCRMYLLDVWRRQASTDAWIEAFATSCSSGNQLHGPRRRRRSPQELVLTSIADSGSGKLSFIASNFPSVETKAVRAQSIRGRMALQGLYVPTNASWYPEFRSELLGFPAGKHDDQVDALGLIGQLLDQMVAGQAPKKPVPPKPDSGYRPIALCERPDDWLCY